MKQYVLRLLRTLARPLLGKGYWEAPVLRSIAAWYYRAFRPPFVEIEGSRLYLNYDDGYFSSYIAVHGYWEKMETELIRRHVRPGMSALDLGANIGYYTLLLSALVGESGTVVAFEPEETCLRFLEKNVGNRSNVEVVPAAAWHESGEIAFYINPDDAMDHTTSPIRSHHPSRTIKAVAVDDIVGDRTFDFVKMDIQGAEGHALEGMRRLLERKVPAVMILEYWPAALAKAGTNPEELFNWLVELGYAMYIIDEEGERISPISLQSLSELCNDEIKFTNLLCLQPS